MSKDFEGWHQAKIQLQLREDAPIFGQREVWWCSMGVNVGDEMDGKGQFYTRPVLIVRKFNRRIFLGVPLTTQIKENPYYHRIQFKDIEQCVMISQLRLWEGKRLRSRMGKLPSEEFEKVREALRYMI